MTSLVHGKRPPRLARLRAWLRQGARPQDAAFLQRFFKTSPGEYGEGDKFLGVRVPWVRQVARQSDGLKLAEVRHLLHSPYHEERLLALLILVRRFERGTGAVRGRLFQLYLGQTRFINNWDLVDCSAPNIVGAWLLDRPRGILFRLARSNSLWERRIAVLATLAFIRDGQVSDSLTLCRQLLGDEEPLIHKACGWMLREAGKRDRPALESFLKRWGKRMPRTTLRYAIERLPGSARQSWLRRSRLRPVRLAGLEPGAENRRFRASVGERRVHKGSGIIAGQAAGFAELFRLNF